MQKILHIIDTLSIGGAEKLVVRVVKALDQFEHHVVYLCGSDTLAKELPPACHVLRLGYSSKLDIPRSVLKLRKYAKQHGIQIIHSHLFLSTFIARLACPAGCRLITTLHSLPGKIRYSRSTLIKWADKLTYRKHHEIIAVSEDVLQAHHAIINFEGPCYVLPNFAADKFYAKDYKRQTAGKTLRLVSVGSLKKSKNYSFILDAFRYLSPGIQLDIYGKGEQGKELQRKIDEDKLPVRLCGERQDIYALLPKYDAFILGSAFEGHSIALLEAMASGLPVILSDIPAFRKTAGADAIYFNLTNNVDLARKLADLTENKAELEEKAKASFEKAKREAGKTAYLEKLASLYEGVKKEFSRIPEKSAA